MGLHDKGWVRMNCHGDPKKLGFQNSYWICLRWPFPQAMAAVKDSQVMGDYGCCSGRGADVRKGCTTAGRDSGGGRMMKFTVARVRGRGIERERGSSVGWPPFFFLPVPASYVAVNASAVGSKLGPRRQKKPHP